MGINLTERIAALFRAKLPGSWMLLARVEGDESMFPANERITAAFLRGVAESYDPAVRKAPVVSAWGGKISGSSHVVGELNPPLGWVERVSFDGLNLWGFLSDVNGRLHEAMEAGLERGSVSIWEGLPMAEGKPYLRHFALLANEHPGTENLGSLADDYFAGYDTSEVAVARELKDAAFITRTTPEQDKENDMEIEQALKSLADDLGKRVDEGIGKVGDKLRSLEEATTKQAQAIEAVQAENVKLRERNEAVAAENARILTEARERTVRSEITTLVRGGRVLPKEVDAEVEILLGLDETKYKERIATLQSRPAMSFAAADLPKLPTGGKSFLRSQDLTSPNRTPNPEAAATVARLMAESGGDPEKFREAAYAMHGEAN